MIRIRQIKYIERKCSKDMYFHSSYNVQRICTFTPPPTMGMKHVSIKMGYPCRLYTVIRYYDQSVLEYPNTQWAKPALTIGSLILMISMTNKP